MTFDQDLLTTQQNYLRKILTDLKNHGGFLEETHFEAFDISAYKNL